MRLFHPNKFSGHARTGRHESDSAETATGGPEGLDRKPPFGVAPSAPTQAWAATGTITVNPPANTADGVTTTYKLYKVFDATGNGNNISYKLLDGKNTVPDVAAQYSTLSEGGRRMSPANNPHFIVDTSGNVYYGTEKDDPVTGGAGATTDIQVYANSEGKTFFPQQEDTTEKTVHFLATTGTNIDAYTIAAIKVYINNDTPTLQQDATKGSGASGKVEFANVDDGYYYITTSTGSVVMINSNNPNANVDDKNQAPAVNKTITGVTSGAGDDAASEVTGSVDTNGKNAIAQVGSKVSYSATVTFNSNYSNIKYHDTMETGLSLNESSISINFYEGSNLITGTSVGEYYTIRTASTASKPDSNDTFTVDFNDRLANRIGTHQVTSAVITYAATVTEDALTRNPDQNTATVTYGSNNAHTTKVQTSVYDAKFTVTKQDGAGNPLAGAGFKITRRSGVGSSAVTQYYRYIAKTDTVPEHVEWVTDSSQATEYISGSDGQLYQTLVNESGEAVLDSAGYRQANTSGSAKSFVGLSDGSYTLVESQTPRGYNTAADYTFTVVPATNTETVTEDGIQVLKPFSASNLEQSTTVKNNAGAALPTTGGPGTAVLYAVGAVLVVAAGVALVARRRMRRQ